MLAQHTTLTYTHTHAGTAHSAKNHGHSTFPLTNTHAGTAHSLLYMLALVLPLTHTHTLWPSTLPLTHTFAQRISGGLFVERGFDFCRTGHYLMKPLSDYPIFTFSPTLILSYYSPFWLATFLSS